MPDYFYDFICDLSASASITRRIRGCPLPASQAAQADAAEIAKLRRKLQLIEEEYAELGRRLWQLDDD
jgi:hypothetical protein